MSSPSSSSGPSKSSSDSSTAGAGGRIHSLVVENFKSYGGRNVIGPFRDFTAVIGPNGSGKSNLMDAISFVLGLQSRELRSHNLAQLIHQPPSGRERPTRASVEVLYDTEEGKRMSFRRNIVLSKDDDSAASSSYAVNGKTRTYTSYRQSLASIGVLVKARNFLVFQGDVESIAQKSPRQITAMIEALAYDEGMAASYQAAAVAAQAAEEEYARVFEHKRDVAKERKQVAEQKEEAEAYELMLQQEQTMKQRYYLFQLYHVQTDYRHNQEKLATLRSELQEQASELKQLEAALEEKGTVRNRLRRELNKRKQGIAAAKKKVIASSPKLIELKEQVAFLRGAVTRGEKKVQAEERKLTQHREEIARLAKDLKAIDVAVADFQSAMSEQDAGVKALHKKQLGEYNQLKAQAASETAQQRTQAEAVDRALRLAREQLDTLLGQRSTLEARVAALSEQQSQYSGQLSEFQSQLGETTQALKVAQDLVLQQRRQQAVSSDLRRSLETRIRACEQSIQASQASAKRSERLVRMAACVETLKEVFEGKVHGRVVDLCRPVKKQYERAVEVALGRNLNAVIVEDDATAIECIEYLKAQRIGAATFLPLSTLQAKGPSERDRRLGQGVQVALDCVEFSELHYRAFAYCLENTLIAPDLDVGRKLAYKHPGRFKVVTMAGAVVHRSGNLTGGVSARRGGGAGWGGKSRSAGSRRSSRRRGGGEEVKTEDDQPGTGSVWDEKDVVRLVTQRDSLMKKLNELPSVTAQVAAIRREEINVSTFRERCAFLNKHIDAAKVKLTSATQDIAACRKQLAALKPKVRSAEREVGAAEEKCQALQQEISVAEERVFADFARRAGVKSVSEFETARLSHVRKQQEMLGQLQTQHARVRNQLLYEQKKQLDGPLLKAREALDRDRDSLRERVEQEKKARETHQRLVASLKEKHAELETFSKEVNAAVKEFRIAKARAEACHTRHTQVDKQLALKEGQLEHLGGLRAEIIRLARLDQVELPYRPGYEEHRAERAASMARERKQAGKKRGRKKTPARSGRRGRAATASSSSSSSEDSDSSSSGSSSESSEEEEEEEGSSSESDQAGGDAEAGGEDIPPDAADWVDFALLNERKYREVTSPEQYEEIKKRFKEDIGRLAAELEKVAPNMKAISQFKAVAARAAAAKSEWDAKKLAQSRAQEAFDLIKKRRYTQFMKAYTHVSGRISDIYSALTRVSRDRPGGNAYLVLMDQEEPYLHGVKYSAMPAGKRFREMEQLSGGEKTLASIALLFALHSYRQAPFFVMDEVDAALDSLNVGKVSSYIAQRCAQSGLQCIVISLKDAFYSRADALVGIYRDREQGKSGVLTYDLSKCDSN